jgi:hypothetical protein
MTSVAIIETEPQAGPSQVVLRIEFEAPGGRRWRAIGGGPSRREALAFAYDSAPTGPDWRAVRVDDLYGD